MQSTSGRRTGRISRPEAPVLREGGVTCTEVAGVMVSQLTWQISPFTNKGECPGPSVIENFPSDGGSRHSNPVCCVVYSIPREKYSPRYSKVLHVHLRCRTQFTLTNKTDDYRTISLSNHTSFRTSTCHPNSNSKNLQRSNRLLSVGDNETIKDVERHLSRLVSPELSSLWGREQRLRSREGSLSSTYSKERGDSHRRSSAGTTSEQ